MIQAFVGADGSVRLVLDGVALKFSGESLTDARARVVEAAVRHAQATERVQELQTEEPDGDFTVWVFPSGEVSDTEPVADEDRPDAAPVPVAPPAFAPDAEETRGRDGAEEDFAERTTTLPPSEPVLGETVPRAARRHAPLRKRAWLMIAAAGVVSCAFTGYAVAQFGPGVVDFVAGQTAPAKPESALTVPGFGGVVRWTLPESPLSVAAGRSGEQIAYATSRTVAVVDARTGDALASVPLHASEMPQVKAVGDGFAAADSGAVLLHSGAGVAAWNAVEVGDGQVLLRGDALFVRRGGVLDLLDANGGSVQAAPPTPGAVPVTGQGGRIVWANSAHELITTGPDGVPVQRAQTKPQKSAAVPSWLGGDETHVYVAWSTGGEAVLQVVDTATGTVAAERALPAGVPEGGVQTTGDGTLAVVAGLLVDATTGQFVETSATHLRVAGEWVVGVVSGSDVRVLPSGDITPVAAAGVRILTATPAGVLCRSGKTISFVSPGMGDETKGKKQ